MNVSRASVQNKASCLPEIRSDLTGGLTSYSGLVIFAALFKSLKLRTQPERSIKSRRERLPPSAVRYRYTESSGPVGLRFAVKLRHETEFL